MGDFAMRALCQRRRVAVIVSLVAWAVPFLISGGRAALAQEKSKPPREARECYALLIGVDDYSYARDLRYCGADQRALYERLVMSGFPKDNIFLLHDQAKETRFHPSKQNIERHLELVLKLADSEGDLIVVAFSGHGVQLKGKSYLCPTDAERQAIAETIRVATGVRPGLASPLIRPGALRLPPAAPPPLSSRVRLNHCRVAPHRAQFWVAPAFPHILNKTTVRNRRS
jgi:hypothetical protein